MPWLRMILNVMLFLLLTLTTQVGGIVWLLYNWILRKPINAMVNRKNNRWLHLCLALGFYLLVISTITPWLAAMGGRVPLPVFGIPTKKLLPANYWTVLCNRHYVTPRLLAMLEKVAHQMPQDTPLFYLDANFPFFKGFPLIPHLSHDDGKKVDLSFAYYEQNGDRLHGSPNWLGYGYVEEAQNGELSMAKECAQKGFWQYGLLAHLIGVKPGRFLFDSATTKQIISLIAQQKEVEKIFLEPHLKSRLGLVSNKIRFHGCHAVRHDDHIHVQIN